ncbi:MAG TPA: hypothetical protein VGP31_19895 [Planosporangium sp.]|nr:hypothetical protein [Planosporangium sp.]
MNRSDDQPAWAADLEPAPAWVMRADRHVDGWTVEARWWGQAEEPASLGPSTVVIQLSSDAPADVRQRGINSGVLRRMEHLVSDMASEVHDMPSVGAYAAMARRYVADRLAQLPDGPRQGGDTYYLGLLNIYEDVSQKGHPEPLNLLSQQMGIPKDTLKTRLRVARQRRETRQQRETRQPPESSRATSD